ncbi:MAG: PKD domain-containing protein, partial [Thermoplasmata archaeon]|nr:PKD domain-containing protein [Thermoplasmata archaeon]
ALEFSISTAGGYPPFTTQWQFGDGTAESASGALALNHTYLGAGIFAVRAEVTDSRGADAHVLTWVVVEPALQALVNASTEAGPAPLFVGFTAQVQGGEPPYVVEWNFGIGGSMNGTNISYDFGTLGVYEVQVRVTDALGGHFNATVPIMVGPAVAVVPLPPLSVNGSALAIEEAACGDSSSRFAFSALASGGVAPYTFVWKFGDGAVGGGSLVDHT